MTAGPPATSDPIAAVPPPEVIRRMLDDLTRRRTLLQSLLRTSVRISNWLGQNLLGKSFPRASRRFCPDL